MASGATAAGKKAGAYGAMISGAVCHSGLGSEVTGWRNRGGLSSIREAEGRTLAPSKTFICRNSWKFSSVAGFLVAGQDYTGRCRSAACIASKCGKDQRSG